MKTSIGRILMITLVMFMCCRETVAAGEVTSGQETAPMRISISLRPTEGVLFEFLEPRDVESKLQLSVDPSQSDNLDCVDITDLGRRPGRLGSGTIGNSFGGKLKNLFESPRLLGWGIRARKPGNVHLVLSGSAIPAELGDTSIIRHIDIEVTEDLPEAHFQLSFRPGEKAVFELWTNPSTGAEWRVDPEASAENEAYEITRGSTYNPADPTDWRLRDRPGAPNLQEWTVLGLAEGKFDTGLVYGPPWEKKTKYRRTSISLEINGRQ